MKHKNSSINVVFQNDGVATITIPFGFYSKDAILKACYNNLDSAHIKLGQINKDFVIEIKTNTDKPQTQLLLDHICDDLIDFELRDIITQQTKEIRTALVQKAFAN
jgi:His-Xaa-Ser system protein HxsD